MYRILFTVALLLAAAPAARATELTSDPKPELRAVEVAAPQIRQEVKVQPAQAEARKVKARRAVHLDQNTLLTVLIVVLLVVVIAAVA